MDLKSFQCDAGGSCILVLDDWTWECFGCAFC